MGDNKSLTQEELNLYYYEKMIEKTYLLTRKCNRWTDLDYEFIDETTSETEYFSYVLVHNYCGNGLMFQLGEDGAELYLKDLLNPHLSFIVDIWKKTLDADSMIFLTTVLTFSGSMCSITSTQ